jgi:hypothetical protein
MAEKIILKHSSIEEKRPNPAYLEPGEIALNLSEKTGGLFFKDSVGAIRKIGPVTISNNPPNSLPAPGGSVGNSVGEMWINPLSGHSIKIWDGELWQDCGAVGYTSDKPPEEPQNGQLWFDLISNDLKVYVSEEERWVGRKEDSFGVNTANTISLGVGNSPYEIYVDPIRGTDAFTNSGTDERSPFRTLNRALLEAAKRSILPGKDNDDFDKILIRCKSGDNLVYNAKGSLNTTFIKAAKDWGDPSYQRFLDGANLLVNNRDWMIGKAFSSMNAAYRASSGGESIGIPDTTQIKLLLRGTVDSISLDLKSGGNSNTVGFAKSFYDGNGVLTAFTDLLLKDLFLSVAIPELLSRSLLALQNRGALVDYTISPDLEEDLCANVQSAVRGYYDIFSRTLRGSLLIKDVPVTKGTFPTEPSKQDLEAFNDPFTGGLIIPRGVSIQGADLRKTNILPDFVPAPNAPEDNAIFRMTGGSFFFNFTFKDNPFTKRSHHRLRCFTFASSNQLDLYYQKVAKCFGLSIQDIDIIDPETNIVFTSTSGNVDTTLGSSPYVFNCSVRSDFGLSGIEVDGGLVGGLKSLVSAQFTNVSLQTDPLAWEVYDGETSEWRDVTSYQEVIDSPVENTRYKQDYRGFAFKAKNGAYMQLVSCFVIGNAVHYWSESGGDLSITNSTSNFGGTSCLAEGFSSNALGQDSDFAIEGIIRPLALPIDQSSGKSRRVRVGVVESVSTSNPSYNEITLEESLFLSSLGGFSLEPGGIIYLTDSSGLELKAFAISFPDVDPQNPNDLGSKIRLEKVGDTISSGFGVEGRELYLKRYIDFRPFTERAYKFRVRTTKAGTRRPQINFIFRLMSGASVGQNQIIASGAQLDPENGRNYAFYISNVEDVLLPNGEVDNDTFDLTLLSLDPFLEYNTESTYAIGSYCLYLNKVYRSLKPRNTGNTPATSPDWWEGVRYQQENEEGIHQDSRYAAVRLIINKDDGSPGMGLTREDYDDPTQNFSFQTIDRILELLGYNLTTRNSVLQPQLEEDRIFDPANLPNPSGGMALESNNFPVEFNRPSLIRASGHTWEWVGYYNYSKAIPARQNSVLSLRNRESALGNEIFGGRVYSNGLTEEGELFQNGQIEVRQSVVDSTIDFNPVDTGIVSKVLSLQVGTCEVPGDLWLSTNNLKLCGDLRLESSAQIQDRFNIPVGFQARFGTGTSGTATGPLYGLSRPATVGEATGGQDQHNFITASLLREAQKAEIGRVSFFASSLIPYQNYLVCDGSSLLKAQYPRLYNYLRGREYDTPLSDTVGVSPYGETSNSFVLPDLRGRFLRGWSGAGVTPNGLDPSRAFGTYQQDEFKTHNHGISDPGHVHFIDPGQNNGPGGPGEGKLTGSLTLPTSSATTGISILPSGGTETRPHNIALLPCIRFQ